MISLYNSLKVVSLKSIGTMMLASVLMCSSSAMDDSCTNQASLSKRRRFGSSLSIDVNISGSNLSSPFTTSTSLIGSGGFWSPPVKYNSRFAGANLIGSPLGSSVMRPCGSIVKDFKVLPNPYEERVSSPVYDKNLDRYIDVYSVNQNESDRHPRQNNPYRYRTKGGRFLNASKVVRDVDKDSKEKFSIIATQAPMEETFDDFLDLLYKSKKIDGVVVLGEADKSDWTRMPGDIPAYFSNEFPHRYEDEMGTTKKKLYHFKRIEPGEPYSGNGMKYEISIVSPEGKERQPIPVYHFPAWSDRNVPDNVEDFIHFAEQFRDKRKLVVHCSAGIGRTGVFAAYLKAMRTGVKGEIDPYEIVCDMRQYRKGMVQTEEQFDFLCYLCQRIENAPAASCGFTEFSDYHSYFQGR